MGKIWFFMITISIVVSFFTRELESLNNVILIDAQEAVNFAISLIGIMSVWLGLMNIAKQSGLIDTISSCLKPITNFLFPEVPKNHPAISAIVMNMVANMFGAGNSATALGIKAVEELQTLNKDKKRATNAMCMFLVINMSSVQLVPLNILRIRADAASASPTEIIGAGLIATLVSTIVGITVCKIMGRV